MLSGKRVVVTGGTGSLGQALVRRLLEGEMGEAAEIVVFSRDEAKQHEMRLAVEMISAATDDIVYRDGARQLHFRIGDVSDYGAVCGVLRRADIVINAAALKQVPACEYAPSEAVKTNIHGPENIVRCIRDLSLPVEAVVCVSTDKACKPVNVMGMTKAIQERIFIQANMECPGTRIVAVRYGNVLASRGSVVPLFHHQITNGGPVTITTPDMTRFLLSLDRAVDVVFAALRSALPGEILVPLVPSARIVDVARALVGSRRIETVVTGIRPGEKVHEVLISEEESPRTVLRGDHYAITPALPELHHERVDEPFPHIEFSSATAPIGPGAVEELLRTNHLMVEDGPSFH
jgi:UDP-glucose 4-epimerase